MKTYSAADFKRNKTWRIVIMVALLGLFAYLFPWVSKRYASKMVWLYGAIAAVSLGGTYWLLTCVSPINSKEVEAHNARRMAMAAKNGTDAEGMITVAPAAEAVVAETATETTETAN